MRKIFYILIIILLVTLPLGCSYLKTNPVKVFVDEGINYTSKIEDNMFYIYKADQWEKLVIKGVNIDDTPSDMKEKEFVKWFNEIGEMNANSIKVNTVQTPEFYKALGAYNKNTEKPIYLFQSILIDGILLDEIQDPFKLDNIVPFKEDIDKTIDIIHGKSGKYNTDVSAYVMGYILGVKWNPEVVDYTNRNRPDKKEYEGKFVFTESARPFENFLANVMDHAIIYETEKYKWQHPISFLNSVTTDILTHQYEPIKEEDLISINPNVIKVKDNTAGQFASYQVYPYYPEFLNLDPKYTKFIDHRGKANNYAGYINDLISVHEIPVIITEFGLPSSRGLSSVSVHGYNKGLLTENEQGTLLANMFEDIVVQGGAGGIISNWQDQWTIWSNAQNSDEHFGILSFDRLKVKVDGDINEWKKNKIESFYTTDKKSENRIKNLYIDHDEKYLYFAIKYDGLKNSNLDTLIFLDTIKNQGKEKNLFNENIIVNSTDYIIHISKKGLSKVLKADDSSEDNNAFVPIKLQLSEEITHFKTGQKLSSTSYETGFLREGNGNPESKYYDSLSDYNISEQNNIIEIRIPWSLIGFVNPSTKNITDSLKIDGIGVTVAAYNRDIPEDYNLLPESGSSEYKIYTWENWDEDIKLERLKVSYGIIKDMFSKY